jgi:hypothetical protein
MYIKYKSLSNQKVSIINVNLSNCKTITTEENKLIINMPEDSKDKTISLALMSNDDSIKALDKLFGTLSFKAPLGNLLDLTKLDEDLIINEENLKESETEEE